ncbi:MAG: UDP-4-amino-4,6-dideoxy-N-acetyl-beta-L-altrosamine transaminase [Eubacterium sp.]|nr:UDP-4-amino-4,6-dideoxy-N-acetyl-beta-L-altrosamine transaminase [Eubacterium sp.]
MIPYGHQTIDEKDIQAVVDVLRSDYLTTGPAVEIFEKKVAEYVGAKYAVAVNSGTAALHIACLAAGMKEGDEVITTPITFAASANCVLYCNGTPVFADIDSRTYNILPEEIEKKITPRTKAIVPVHFTGQPCDMDAISAIAKKHSLIVIEDGAHALGASYRGKKIGSISDMTIFSFHPVKPITTGEGGMVVTNSENLYRRLKLFRSHGITREENMMESSGEIMTGSENGIGAEDGIKPGNGIRTESGGWYYQQIELGFNYRMTDIQAALGSSQMDKLDTFLNRRREIARRYNEAFAGNPNIGIPQQMKSAVSGWHLYVIRVPADRRKEIFRKLQSAGIGVNVHYIPVYRHPYYQKHEYGKVCCPNAEELYGQMISLPIYPGLTDGQQKQVMEAVLKICDF